LWEVRPPTILEVPVEVKKLVELREKLRKQKKWREADQVRKEIEKIGWQIEDTDKGPKTKRMPIKP